MNIPNKEAGGDYVEKHFAPSLTQDEAPDQHIYSYG